MELLNCIFCPLWAGSKALQMYEEMRLERIQPTDVTLLSLLHACCHSVVDLLGWAGLLTKEKHIIDGLPENWQAFLGSCSIHGDPKMGIYVVDQFFVGNITQSNNRRTRLTENNNERTGLLMGTISFSPNNICPLHFCC